MVDRNILRLAHYEVVQGGVPPRVAINEAVELAREFGGAKSPSFVNGVLDRLFRALLRPESEAGESAEQSPEVPQHTDSAADQADAAPGSAGRLFVDPPSPPIEL
jgi:N utilization substance protein B